MMERIILSKNAGVFGGIILVLDLLIMTLDFINAIDLNVIIMMKQYRPLEIFSNNLEMIQTV